MAVIFRKIPYTAVLQRLLDSLPRARQDTKERWEQICAQVAVEQDGEKLLELVKQINELLEEKERRLGVLPPKPQKS